MRLVFLLRRVAMFTGIGVLLISLPSAADELQDVSKLISAGQTSPALEKLNEFLKEHPKDAQGRFMKGIVLTEQGKQNEAIEIFSALTEEYPELPEPYNNLAVIYASQGQYEKARNALELAIHTHPSYGTAHENLGDVYAKLATKSYDKALQLDKTNNSAKTKLALIRTLFDKSAASAAPPPVPAQRPEPAMVDSKPAVTAAKAPPPKVVEAEKPAKVVDPETGAVSETVKAWAAAWSAKNPDRYLAFYAPEFKTPNGEDRAEWEKVRRERLSKPGPIQVQLQDVNVQLGGKDTAEVSFRQKYSSANLRSSNLKTLYLRRVGDQWKIVEERVRG